MSARDEILGRVRSALRDAPAAPQPDRTYRRTSTMSEDARIELLVDRLVDYKAKVQVVGPDQVADRIADLLAGTGDCVVPAGFTAAWLPADNPETGPRIKTDGPESPLALAELDGADAVLTASAAAVAQTGTIILDGSPGQGRRAISLVPDRHICVVEAAGITELLPEALARLDGTRPITMISGPSATSDIELERVEGVHGPRNLEVVIVRSRRA
ncbi:LUD domain-containing protein [Arthrobacter ginkgonis]|uniref:LUD domain-containing protein n=1 Tax=Arthrobacter ginkgonis TaxID=1630594 RepID=A0ABP7CED1_9MICC